ncbi:threonine dehydratase [Chryseobacterium sp. T16E-39]|uniref:threonine ammonia-lyase IlvA n=1 Tax=Chryseobacterium sp. T16E-39 TaxID=2015076 RepID=UPI000B5B23D3|nr:threonine ammonia-lyase IlvA [Chryseobacterium sp. T16E-39]ASK29043.1 threonine dehydratase [Chryseobacterium sp. T16E-39]
MNMKNRTVDFPSLYGVEEARKTLENVIHTTPLQKSFRLSKQSGADIFLKREDMQPVRSYKIRGAYNKIYNLYKEDKTGNGIVCASAGNHAQGVAFACRKLKINGTIFMPVTTPKQKLEQVAMFGEKYVEIKLIGDTFDDSKNAAIQYSKSYGAEFIHPFDDVEIIEGQATLAMEILEQTEDPIDFVFVPLGGGGLAAGIITVFSVLSPKTKIIVVEPKGAASMKASLEAGVNTELLHIDKFVDGAAVQKVGDLTFEICKDHIHECLAVDEGKVCETLLEVYNKDAMVLEPAGALTIAALDLYKQQIAGKNIVCIVSGSNNDITRTEEIKERAMLYKGLKHYFIVKFPQRPGALKEFVLHVLGTSDDITFFEYTKRNSRETASAIVGIEVPSFSDFEGLLRRMKEAGYYESYLNDSPNMMNILI